MDIQTRSPAAGEESCALRKAKAPLTRRSSLSSRSKGHYTSSPARKTLRPHQQEATAAVFNRLDEGVDKQLIEAATGTGKTYIGVNIAREFASTLFLVHRQELLSQTIRTAKAAGIKAKDMGVIWGDRHEADKPFVVGMIQTVYSRLGKIPSRQFECAIFDEAHHATARTWRAVAEHFTPKLRLGLSATPERADGAPLNDLFDEISYSLDIRTAIAEGLLVKPLACQIRTSTSLDGVKVLAGDFNEGGLQEAVDTPERNQLVADKYLEYAKGRKALIFAAGIEHAANLAGAFCKQGIKADHVYGNDPRREAKLKAFAKGKIKVLTNAMVLTEGFDQPDVGAVLLARPTKSRPLFAQMLGRGLRLAPGKENCVVLDFVDTASRHSLVTAWNFFGHQGEPDGLADVSKPTAKQQALKAAIEQLGLSVELETLDRLVDLLQPPPEVNPFSFGDHWHHRPATMNQIATLERNGFEASQWTRGQASTAINNLPITDNQKAALLARGFDVLTKSWTWGMASAAFELAKKQGVKADWSLVRRVGL